MKLACRQISFRYGSTAPWVFKGLDWTIREGGFHALFGFSGAGKSTLARLAAGLISPQEGEVERPGRVLYCHNSERLPGWQSINRHLYATSSPEGRGLIPDIAKALEIHELGDKRFSELSMGQKNRANLARYLLQEFDTLILDEALANVDEPARQRIIVQAKERLPHKTFIYISHHVHEVALFAHWIHILPHTPSGPTRALMRTRGLNASTVREIDPEKLEKKVVEILRLTATGARE